MKLLHDRIIHDGLAFDDGTLKVDSFINHQMDPILMKSIAVEFVRRFANLPINKIVTIEASGIAPATPKTMEKMYLSSVYSFTKDRTYDVCVSEEYLSKDDNVLFIDDFLANGNAALGVKSLIDQAGATLCGMGFIIEKSFQEGHERLESLGINVQSLARIGSLAGGKVQFLD